ncbi:MAG: hypothetical protein IRZ31_17940 [Thermogemmatispora sp.]|uniref:hypothetical protein n=1 Tax=Thermogemmatispora sp. TaxID=1968838 RepID=UPI00261D84FC|nr:hypothetical protein [Thermogemmatispora sp.]MBX5458777.1 hypothetical protein [Thermogemmatispora sp.]
MATMSGGRAAAAAWCPVCGLSVDRLQQWIAWLERKQERERAYLDRRARRGVRTPTDEVYEADQRQLTALLLVLRQGLASAQAGGAGSQLGSLVPYPDEE